MQSFLVFLTAKKNLCPKKTDLPTNRSHFFEKNLPFFCGVLRILSSATQLKTDRHILFRSRSINGLQRSRIYQDSSEFHVEVLSAFHWSWCCLFFSSLQEVDVLRYPFPSLRARGFCCHGNVTEELQEARNLNRIFRSGAFIMGVWCHTTWSARS